MAGEDISVTQSIHVGTKHMMQTKYAIMDPLIDTIYVKFGGHLFHQVIRIPMGTDCAPLLAGLFLYSYERDFPDNMIRSGHRKLATSFNLCFR